MKAVRSVLNQWLFLFSDDRALRSHFGIQCGVISPLLRQIVLREDCLDRTLGNTRFAVDALVRVNEDDGFAFVKTLHRADDNAICVLAVKTGFGNDMGHDKSLSVDLPVGSLKSFTGVGWFR